jgi:hypothetical protein
MRFGFLRNVAKAGLLGVLRLSTFYRRGEGRPSPPAIRQARRGRDAKCAANLRDSQSARDWVVAGDAFELTRGITSHGQWTGVAQLSGRRGHLSSKPTFRPPIGNRADAALTPAAERAKRVLC